LEEAGTLQLEDEDESGEGEQMEVARLFEPVAGTMHRGAPWYESLVEDTPLGRVKRQKGRHTSGDGAVEIEWEVVEWTEGNDDNEGSTTPGKRKIGEVEESEDLEMRT
jgi:hypothetical protein